MPNNKADMMAFSAKEENSTQNRPQGQPVPFTTNQCQPDKERNPLTRLEVPATDFTLELMPKHASKPSLHQSTKDCTCN